MFHVYLCNAVLFVPCSCVITCWERVYLLALLCNDFLVFCYFPIWCIGSGMVLDCIDSNLCSPLFLNLLSTSRLVVTGQMESFH